jgi:hypothetical protein
MELGVRTEVGSASTECKKKFECIHKQQVQTSEKIAHAPTKQCFCGADLVATYGISLLGSDRTKQDRKPTATASKDLKAGFKEPLV